jgi:hypothetical protein
MASNPEDQHEKEGVCMADIIKALVLAWSGAMASFGIERKSNGNGNKKPTIVDNKDTKAGIK